MKEFITEVLEKMHRETTTDRYGQVSRNKFVLSLFGDRANEVEQYCKENKGILQISTYGSSYGTYKAFTIEDETIRKACHESLRKNENYLRNINSW